MSEVDKAVALLWFADHFAPGAEKTVLELAGQMEHAALTGKVNVSRLRRKLARSKDTVRGTGIGTFRLRLARRSVFTKEYLPLLRRRRVTVSEAILPRARVEGTKSYLERLAEQINGCYDLGFYDGCAVMCRRMVESLLISSFENAGHRPSIQNRSGNLLGLEEIIGRARSGQYVKLARTSGKILDKVKEVGDTAAHDRYYITEEQDIADFRSGFRKVVAELMALAGIEAKG